MTSQEPDWTALNEKFPAELVTTLRGYLAGGGELEITAGHFASRANSDLRSATRLLDTLAETGALSIEHRFTCPCDRKEALVEEKAVSGLCPYCEKDFDADIGARPRREKLYIRHAPRSRDVCWMLALHGMNTPGAWQESFNWLAALSYGHSVPVAIYKYGIVRPGAILRFRQRALMRGLQKKIRRLSEEGTLSGFGGKPDVIAHSFGTWLLGHALMDDPGLRVGRVVLTGCILRPDFDWKGLMDRSQVEAVLCHAADKDFWAGIAHYIIPDSGPSGRRGFNDRDRINHAILTGGRHSDFFLDECMPEP
jgi:hypothetical protein